MKAAATDVSGTPNPGLSGLQAPRFPPYAARAWSKLRARYWIAHSSQYHPHCRVCRSPNCERFDTELLQGKPATAWRIAKELRDTEGAGRNYNQARVEYHLYSHLLPWIEGHIPKGKTDTASIPYWHFVPYDPATQSLKDRQDFYIRAFEELLYHALRADDAKLAFKLLVRMQRLELEETKQFSWPYNPEADKVLAMMAGQEIPPHRADSKNDLDPEKAILNNGSPHIEIPAGKERHMTHEQVVAKFRDSSWAMQSTRQERREAQRLREEKAAEARVGNPLARKTEYNGNL